MVTKNNVIKIEAASLAVLLVTVAYPHICPHDAWCRDYIDVINFFARLALPLIVLIPFSLITYKMPDNVFRAWWSFAWPWVFVMSAVMLVFSIGGSGSRLSGAYSASLLGLIMLILGSVYFIGSTVKILHARKK